MSVFKQAIQKAALKARKQAGLPPVPKNADPETRQFLQAMRENLAVRMGQEGDPLEQAVTFKDFAKAGMLRLQGDGLLSPNYPPQITPGAPDFDYSPPPAPTNLTAAGGFDIIFLEWDNPGLKYNYYTEVWRSSTDVLDLASPDMAMVGTANASMYLDNFNGDRTVYFYWVRFVKAIGNQLVYGPFNSTAGTSAQITLDPQYILDIINGQIGESELADEVLAPILTIPSIQDTLDEYGIRIPTIEQTVGDHAIAIPDMQTLLDNYGPRIQAAEGTIVQHGQDISGLQASLQSVSGDIVANADAISGLDVRVTTNEQDISAQAGQITALQATLNDINIGAFDANAAYSVGNLFRYDSVVYEVIATQTPPNVTPPNATYYSPQPDYQSIADAVSANSSAVNSLEVRVTANEQETASQASDILLLQSDLANAEGDIQSNAAATSSLATRVQDVEGDITSMSGQITNLQNDLADAEADVAVNANAVSSLQNEVSNINGVISSHSTDITQLENGLTAAEDSIALNAGAISSLTSRVGAAEGSLQSQSTALVNLGNDLVALDGDVSANAQALSLLDNRVTSAEGTLSSQGAAITQLENELSGIDLRGTAAAINSLTTRVDTAEDEITANAQSLTQLQSTVGNNTAAIQTKASTSAVQSVANDVAAMAAQYTIKLDVNGRVSGIGLMNDGSTSEFVVASDAVYFIDPGQSITAFNPNVNYASMAALRNTQFVFGYAQVEGQRRFAINVPAYIPDATITNAMIKDAVITGAKIADATINTAKLNIANIWDLTVGNTIESDNYSSQSGFQLNRNGVFRINGADGGMIMDANGISVLAPSGAQLVRLGRV